MMRASDYIEKDMMLKMTSGSRREIQRTRCSDEIRGTIMKNWHDTLTAMQNKTQWRHLIYKAMENRQRQEK
jgi:hypothetical protein